MNCFHYHFPDPLRVEYSHARKDSKVFITMQLFRFRSSLGTVAVPKGTPTDGASIPRVFWPLLSPYGRYFMAAVPHDLAYSKKNRRFTREQADLILLEAMTIIDKTDIAERYRKAKAWQKRLGIAQARRCYDSAVTYFIRRRVYRAVRLFGGSSFKGGPPEKHNSKPTFA